MKKIILSSMFVLGILAVSTQSVQASGPKVTYTQEGITALSNQAPVHMISIDDIKQSLEGKEPTTVSFDIDDTLVFSS